MSRPRRKQPGNAPSSGGFSMRFTAHASSNEDSDDGCDGASTDGAKASSMVGLERIASVPPARPSKPPSLTTTTVSHSNTEVPVPEDGMVTVSSSLADEDFIILDSAMTDDHFSSPPDGSSLAGTAGGKMAEAAKKLSFYSHPKSEQANTHHDLLSPATTHDDNAPWKRKRQLHHSGVVSIAPSSLFCANVHPRHLMLVATSMMFFWLLNSSVFLLGSAIGAYIMLHFGLLLTYHATKEVLHGDDYIIDFEELHAAMVAHQPVTTGDGVSLMQPKTILKECFGVTREYSGPTLHKTSSAVKMRLRLCGSQLKMSTISGASHIPLVDLSQCIPDSCSDESSSESDSDIEEAAYRHRARSPRHQRAALLSTKSYSLLGCKIRLAPEGLNQRQRWSKKLPLQLVVDTDAQFSSNEDLTLMAETAPVASRTEEFFLFAPTGRAKQDWYMRLKLASEPEQVAKDLASVPAEHSGYAKYMDFLLIHLHPNRATRFNFLRNDATFTSSQLRNMSTTGGSSTGSLQSQSSLASISSAGSSSTASLHSTGSSVSMTDRHGAAPAVKPVVARSTSNQSNFSLKSNQLSQQSGILPDPRRSLHAGSLLWFNAALGRLFYDAWREPRWAEKLRVRWQRKLSRLKTPSYIRMLNMTELDLGDSIPIVRKFSQPRIDSRGLWIDVGISYKGTFQVTIETAINLNPLLDEQVSQSSSSSLSSSGQTSATHTHKMSAGGEDSSIGSVTMAHVQYANMDTMDDDLSTDSDMDSGADEDEADVQDAGPSTSATALATATSMLQSLEKTFPSLSGTLSQVTGMVGADSATEEASALPVVPQPAPSAAPSTTSKLKRFAGFVAHTRIGQSVMKSNVVKKLSEKVSNMPLVLSVELKALYGTMTVNFPPPPSGVVWFSFATPPHITLVAKPRVGQHEVKVNQVTDWIERKLISEFKKRLVMPNMEDIAIPLLSSGMDDDEQQGPGGDGQPNANPMASGGGSAAAAAGVKRPLSPVRVPAHLAGR